MIRICILNWNGGDYLKACLESIQSNSDSNFKVTVIDNNSNDLSLSNLNSNIELVRLDKNYGFGLGYNLGINKCLDKDDEYLLLLNYDTIVPNDFIKKIYEGIDVYGKDYIYGVQILYNSDKEKIWYAGGTVDLSRGLICHDNIREETNGDIKDKDTGYITGCCMLLHKDIFLKLEGFDENFFMYSEDVDLCLRAREIGINSKFLSSPKIFHEVSLSLGGNYSIKKQIYKIKSIYKLVRKYYSVITSFFILVTFMLRLILNSRFR